jgi:ABC-2 type transport system permease protein
MRFSMSRALTIARREFITTIKRRAFLFTVIAMPAYFSFIMTFSVRMGESEVRRTLGKTTTLGLVDSTGLLATAPDHLEFDIPRESNPFAQRRGAPAPAAQRMSTRIVRFPTGDAAEAALRADQVQQVVVLPTDYLEHGGARYYRKETSVMGSGSQERLVLRWLTGALLAGRVESTLVERAARPGRGLVNYTLEKDTGRLVVQDDAREMIGVFLPLLLAALLGTAIVTGGQYLLQGVSEEKESRILESLLCTVSTDDLMVGKMIGLGGAGLAMVGVWTAVGLFYGSPLLAIADYALPATTLLLALTYFLLGYIFYASIMTGIGAITNNMREAQQFAFMFTFANFVPFVTMWATLSQPNGTLSTVMSFIPMTAPTQMMMRLGTGASIPLWHIVGSIAILVASAVLMLRVSSRVFRIGLLLYGKTPNLPEIMRWATSRG